MFYRTGVITDGLHIVVLVMALLLRPL